MESANLHHDQLQDQLVGSSPLASPSCYGVGSTHSWTPNTILNNDNFNPNMNGVVMNSRDSRQQNDIVVSSLNSSMIQDLGFHWPSNGASAAGSFTYSTQSAAHDLHLARIKEELSDSYPKFADMINSNAATIDQDFHLQPTSYLKNEQKINLNYDVNEKLALRNFSSGCQINGLQLPAGEYYSNGRGNFSQIFPTVNISNLNRSSSSISSPLDMNMQALELFSSGGVCGNLSQPSHGHDLGVFRESHSYGFGHMQQSSHRPSNSPTKIYAFRADGVTELAKKPSSSSLLKPKAPQTAAKKSRLESRASCPPFKVRKEKLGDRIATLQQLVAPFGKTDTASVLMEAIGYIKFLQSQVETLSVPYMKSSRNKITSRTTQEGWTEEGKERRRRDLGSRGLCLVPLSCLSYVTDAGGVWPSPNFGGGT